MPTAEHEMPLELFRNRPELAPELLQRVFNLKMPDSVQVTLGSETFTACDPMKFRGDGTFVVGDPAAPELAIVVEHQQRYDKRKRFTWPVYVTTVRARYECPATLLVLCPDDRTAAACAQPIDIGHPEWILKPLVLTPRRIPPITDPVSATEFPELAVLSALGNANGPDRQAVLDALAAALLMHKETGKGPDYYDYVVSQLAEAAQRDLEAIMKVRSREYYSEFARNYFAKGRAEGEAEGEAKGEARGEARAILTFLAARGITVTDQAREQITSCTDLDQLERWIQRAATADTIDDVLI